MKNLSFKGMIVALALAIGAFSFTTQQAQAGRGGYLIGGLVAGALIGAAIHHHRSYDRHYYRDRRHSRYRRHNYRGGRCHHYQRQCGRNWGYRNSDFYGCMRYHGC